MDIYNGVSCKQLRRNKILCNRLCYLCREANFLYRLPIATLVAHTVVQIWAAMFMLLNHIVNDKYVLIMWILSSGGEVALLFYRLLSILYFCERVYDEVATNKHISVDLSLQICR